MPRGGKRKGAGGTRKGAGGKRKGAGGERKGAGAPLGNVNGVENTGGAAPLGNLNGLGNTGGAATVGNTNSSSREKKISSLLAVGLELDRHGAFNEAMSKYREILELDPMHADTHYSIGRLLSRLFYQRDLVNSGPFPLIVEHLRIADRGGCKQAKNCLSQVLLNGNHVGELGECRPHPMDFEEVLEHYKLVVAKVEAENMASPGHPALLAASSLAHLDYALALMTCYNPEDHVAVHVLAESELRIAVEQNPRSFKANTDLATCLMRVKRNADAIDCFKLVLAIRPNNLYATESLKYVEGQVKIVLGSSIVKIIKSLYYRSRSPKQQRWESMTQSGTNRQSILHDICYL